MTGGTGSRCRTATEYSDPSSRQRPTPARTVLPAACTTSDDRSPRSYGSEGRPDAHRSAPAGQLPLAHEGQKQMDRGGSRICCLVGPDNSGVPPHRAAHPRPQELADVRRDGRRCDRERGAVGAMAPPPAKDEVKDELTDVSGHRPSGDPHHERTGSSGGQRAIMVKAARPDGTASRPFAPLGDRPDPKSRSFPGRGAKPVGARKAVGVRPW